MKEKGDWFRDQVGMVKTSFNKDGRLCMVGAQIVSKKTEFRFMREFAKIHYKSGELTLNDYINIILILDKADERMTLESEE